MLEVVDREQRQQHCATVGKHLLGRLHKLAAKHDIIGDIRGSGLMLGVELVKDRTTKVCLWGTRAAEWPSQGGGVSDQLPVVYHAMVTEHDLYDAWKPCRC